MLVKEVLNLKGGTLYTVTPDTQLSDAVISMAEHDIGSVLVLQSGKLVGMLTFREVIAVLAKGQAEGPTGPIPPMAAVKVGDAMQIDPVTTEPAMDIDELRSVMLRHHARYVPVLDGELLLGVISFHDVAKAVLEEKSFENKMLKAYIKDWPQPGQV